MSNNSNKLDFTRMPMPAELSWEEKFLDSWRSFVSEFKKHPINIACMIAVGLVFVGVVFYLLGCYFPIYDPSR
mgnify:CR=1 FL=1